MKCRATSRHSSRLTRSRHWPYRIRQRFSIAGRFARCSNPFNTLCAACALESSRRTFLRRHIHDHALAEQRWQQASMTFESLAHIHLVSERQPADHGIQPATLALAPLGGVFSQELSQLLRVQPLPNERVEPSEVHALHEARELHDPPLAFGVGTDDSWDLLMPEILGLPGRDQPGPAAGVLRVGVRSSVARLDSEQRRRAEDREEEE